jgi:hypothetical protein
MIIDMEEYRKLKVTNFTADSFYDTGVLCASWTPELQLVANGRPGHTRNVMPECLTPAQTKALLERAYALATQI